MTWRPHFETVMERLKSALKLRTDSELAHALGLKPNAYFNRKGSGRVPYAELVQLCDSHNLCADWVLFGLGTPFRDGHDSDAVPTPMPVDGELLGEISAHLERAFAASADAGLPSIEQAAMRGALAAVIYNKVQFAPKGRARTAMIQAEAKALAEVARLMKRFPAEPKGGQR
jgi:hypothetical protein